MSEIIMEKRRKEKEPFYKNPYILIPIIIILLIIIVVIIVLIVNFSKPKDDNKTPGKKTEPELINYISKNSQAYLKELNKLAITDKRIKQLFKQKISTGDYYDDLINLENGWFKVGWKLIDTLENKGELFNNIDKKIENLLSLPENGDGITLNLIKLIIGEGKIEDYKNDTNIKYINEQLNKVDFCQKFNLIFLYSFINLPMQMGYFSNNSTYKNEFMDEIGKLVKNEPYKNIFNNINQNMSNCPEDSIYMVLGAGQGEEENRIKALDPIINLINTGIRTQSTDNEINDYLLDNIENYYTNPKYRSLMEKSTIEGEMDDEKYENFVQDCNELIEDMTKENTLELFSRYNFSVETANTVIEYLKMEVPYENINIIRLGENNSENKNIKYNKGQVFILFNVVDVENSNGYARATTVANAKAVIYLLQECPNFKSNSTEFVLVSGKAYAERQLEAFNILYHINGLSLDFNYVIWNKVNDQTYNEEQMVKYMIEFGVKNFNVICTSLEEFFNNDYKKSKNEKLGVFIEYIKYITQLTNDAKAGKYFDSTLY